MVVREPGACDRNDEPRGTRTRSFLVDCPELIAELFHYWDRQRGRRAMPRRADIDPVDFVAQLPGILLIDVEGLDDAGRGRFRYRVVGTEEVRLRGHDPTGKLIEEGFFGPSRDDVLASYETVRRGRCFLYDPLDYRTPEGRWRDEYTLFLPLSEDGETVSQILVYSLMRSRDGGSGPNAL